MATRDRTASHDTTAPPSGDLGDSALAHAPTILPQSKSKPSSGAGGWNYAPLDLNSAPLSPPGEPWRSPKAAGKLPSRDSPELRGGQQLEDYREEEGEGNDTETMELERFPPDVADEAAREEARVQETLARWARKDTAARRAARTRPSLSTSTSNSKSTSLSGLSSFGLSRPNTSTSSPLSPNWKGKGKEKDVELERRRPVSLGDWGAGRESGDGDGDGTAPSGASEKARGKRRDSSPERDDPPSETETETGAPSPAPPHAEAEAEAEVGRTPTQTRPGHRPTSSSRFIEHLPLQSLGPTTSTTTSGENGKGKGNDPFGDGAAVQERGLGSERGGAGSYERGGGDEEGEGGGDPFRDRYASPDLASSSSAFTSRPVSSSSGLQERSVRGEREEEDYEAEAEGQQESSERPTWVRVVEWLACGCWGDEDREREEGQEGRTNPME